MNAKMNALGARILKSTIRMIMHLKHKDYFMFRYEWGNVEQALWNISEEIEVELECERLVEDAFYIDVESAQVQDDKWTF